MSRPKLPPPLPFRTGRFVCELSGDGRRVVVGDGSEAAGHRSTITAKVTEWRELVEAITVAQLAQQQRN